MLGITYVYFNHIFLPLHIMFLHYISLLWPTYNRSPKFLSFVMKGKGFEIYDISHP